MHGGGDTAKLLMGNLRRREPMLQLSIVLEGRVPPAQISHSSPRENNISSKDEGSKVGA